MSTRPNRLIVMAGGSGGHVFPGLSVAHLLIKQQGWQVRWCGCIDRIEADLVPRYGIEMDCIRMSSLRGKELGAKLSALLCMWRAVFEAKRIINNFHPDVVLGMGGYVSGPGGLAAWLCRIPLVLHEQNGVAGLTNRWLSRIATKVFQALPGAFPDAEVVGNPLRSDVLALPAPLERLQGRRGPIRLLVMGGSQGAQVLNRTVIDVAVRLGDRVTLWHQVGKDNLKIVLNEYKRIGEMQHKVMEFIDDIAAAYAWADVVLCRAGSLTVSEIAAVGIPAIFVPFEHKDRQQYYNARPLEAAGAAKIIEQSHLNADTVCNLLMGWHRPILLAMAKNARALAIAGSAERIVAELIRIVK